MIFFRFVQRRLEPEAVTFLPALALLKFLKKATNPAPDYRLRIPDYMSNWIFKFSRKTTKRVTLWKSLILKKYKTEMREALFQKSARKSPFRRNLITFKESKRKI